jgi:hypothetical protein
MIIPHDAEKRLEVILGPSSFKNRLDRSVLYYYVSIPRDGGAVTITFQRDFDLTFNHLTLISVLFETRNINIVYREGEPDYSELTPGSPASFNLEVRP